MNIALITGLVIVLALLLLMRRQRAGNVNRIIEEARMRAVERSRANAYADTKPVGLDLATALSTTIIDGDANNLSEEQKKVIEALFDGKPATVENITMDKYSDYWKNAQFK